jgi:nucleoside recognition membrane protein YjiH
MKELAAWENFYVIVGSAAGALIGLQFVVMTLIADMPLVEDVERASNAFATPTIVHFASVLLLSAIISAPWPAITPTAIFWGVLGLAGVLYVAITARRMGAQTAYSPVFQDWLFYALLPFAGYGMLVGSAWAARSNVAAALLGVGGAALLLLFVGIHNAWDTVTYHVFVRKRDDRENQKN